MSYPELTPISTIERDVRRAAATLGRDEARFLVDTYYQLQEFRITADGQVRAIRQGETAEPHETLGFFGDQFKDLEAQIKGALDHYSNAQTMGRWARLHVGIGPVIAAGLLAHIDVTRTKHASSVWRFAGLAPGQRKQKGVKRDWNANLKVLCWKLGDSFVKFSNHPDCYYGHLYRQRKAYEIERDARGGNSAEAARTLETLNIRDAATRARYESGHLPDGRLDMRARRYAVKRFLVHYWEAAWVVEYGSDRPRSNPYVFEYGGHTDMEPCPIPYPVAA